MLLQCNWYVPNAIQIDFSVSADERTVHRSQDGRGSSGDAGSSSESRHGVPACDMCGNEFDDEAALQRHMCTQRDSPQKKQPWACPICSMRFGRKSSLRRHQQSRHQRKRYGCRVCGKSYSQKFDAIKVRLMSSIVVPWLNTHLGSFDGDSFLCHLPVLVGLAFCSVVTYHDKLWALSHRASLKPS